MIIESGDLNHQRVGSTGIIMKRYVNRYPAHDGEWKVHPTEEVINDGFEKWDGGETEQL